MLGIAVVHVLLALPAWAEEAVEAAEEASPNKFQGLLVGFVLAVIVGIGVTVAAYKTTPATREPHEHDVEADEVAKAAH